MNVKTVTVGYLRENCYILNIGNDAIIIDPGDEYEKIKKELDGLNLKAILITHRHFDHIGALNNFKNIPIYEYKNIEEKEYNIGKFNFEVIYTKGHTSDSVTYNFKKNKTMFTGDFLFKGTIGRTDLETSDKSEMKKSIEKIKKYENSKIYPGHGKSTTLEEEIKTNPYLRGDII